MIHRLLTVLNKKLIIFVTHLQIFLVGIEVSSVNMIQTKYMIELYLVLVLAWTVRDA